MSRLEPKLKENIGHDALTVWLDFWELSGAHRADLIRHTRTGGNRSKMIPPEIVEVTIFSVPIVIVESDEKREIDRSGKIYRGKIRLELIDTVRKDDRIRFNGLEYRAENVEARDMGEFSVWIVEGILVTRG